MEIKIPFWIQEIRVEPGFVLGWFPAAEFPQNVSEPGNMTQVVYF